LPVGEDDVHRPQEQPIGQLTMIRHELGKQRFIDAKVVG
jgi:hypothetical protein